MTATPMLDKVRQYAKDWGIKIVGDRSGMSGSANLALRPDTFKKFSFTHDGPGIFSIHWPTRKIIEPIRTAHPRGRVATDSDVWYLIHEISHILLNVAPEEVIEGQSAIIALDHYTGRHLGLDGWEQWMGEFTLEGGFPEPIGDSLHGVEWVEISEEAKQTIIGNSLAQAVQAGLLALEGAPTFNRSAWMPLSMRVARALAAVLVEAKR